MGFKEVLVRIPAVRDWRYRKKVRLGEWVVDMAGVRVALAVPANYVDLYNADERKGQLTGIDKRGRYEYIFAVKFKECLKPDTVLFDVGAAYGLYSVFAWSVAKPRQIVCFEPAPLSNWVLRYNNLQYCDRALKVDSRKVAETSAKGSVALDDYCQATGIVPSLIKMDIEGFEFYALQGMEWICRKARPTILIEFHHRKMRDQLQVEPQRLLELLREWGYTLRFNGHHWYSAQHQGEVDEGWYSTPTSEVNYALWAEPIR